MFGDNSTANQYGVSSSGPSMQPCGEPGVLHKAHGIQDSITKYIETWRIIHHSYFSSLLLESLSFFVTYSSPFSQQLSKACEDLIDALTSEGKAASLSLYTTHNKIARSGWIVGPQSAHCPLGERDPIITRFWMLVGGNPRKQREHVKTLLKAPTQTWNVFYGWKSNKTSEH